MSPPRSESAVPTPEALIEFFEGAARRPMSPAAVARRLELSDAAVDGLAAALDRLAEEGLLVRTRQGRFGLPKRMNLAVGRLTCHPDGYGFVAREEDDGPDVFVPARKMGDAMHGDRVVARVERSERDGKQQGQVIRVLERANQRILGTFEKARGGGWVMPRDEKALWDLFVPTEDAAGARDGQVVWAEITEYPKESRSPEGRVVEVLGEAGDARLDVEIVIREFGLPHEFPPEVVAEAARMPERVGREDLAGRTDFRHQPAVTIDGESAQDFDDAVHVERLQGGRYRLSVHIADVAAYVPTGSAIDREARARGTSVYFPRRVVPMLPETLSNGLCSLRPGEDRLVKSAVLEIDGQGRTVRQEIHDGVIRSAARLTYTEVAAALGGDEGVRRRLAGHLPMLAAAQELTTILMESRRQRGSLDFDLPEPELVIALTGEVERIYLSERNLAHRMIEEFMIRANEGVADHLTGADHPCLFRIHEGPEAGKVESFQSFVRGIGLTLGGGAEPRPRHFQKLVEQLEGRPEQAVVSMLLLTVLRQARYSTRNLGHFGLASERYLHFTSPIRRYPDLVVHRLLGRQRGRGSGSDHPAVDPAAGSLEEVARACSVAERKAEEAEREYIDWKKVEFMADKVGQTFTGSVVSVQAFGLFVQLQPHLVTGLVHVSSLGDDYYRLDEQKQRLVGDNKGRAFELGATLTVRLDKVDTGRRRLDLVLAGDGA